jgi:hypothetical protein
MERVTNSDYKQRFQNLLKHPQFFFEYFRMNYQTFNYILKIITQLLQKHRISLFLNTKICNNILFDITVTKFGPRGSVFVTYNELNNCDPYFIQEVAANLMKNQTVLYDVLHRRGSCEIGRTRRTQFYLSHTVSYFASFARNGKNSCERSGDKA